MRIVKARCRPYALPLRRPWRSAQGLITDRQGLLIELRDAEGRIGFGDTAPLPEAGSENSTQAEAWLARELPRQVGLTAERALAQLPPVADHPAARCGLETALLDLQAQRLDLPLARLLNPQAGLRVPVNASLGTTDGQLDARAADALAAGYSVLKIKLGVYPYEQELARLRQLAAQLPAGCRLRLDANRAWPEPECDRWLAALAQLPIESLEEPLAGPTPDRLARLQASTHIPLALDESLSAFGLEAILAAPPVRRLVLKPMVQGGLLPCLYAARGAPDLEWVVTTSVDSAAGTWAASHLAAAIGSPLAQGLATAEWLARDLGRPPSVRAGWLQLPERPGLGFCRSGSEA